MEASPGQETNSFAAYMGAIDNLFAQHANEEITGDTFVAQAAAIVGEFEQNETKQAEFALFSAQLRTMVAAMACCSPETEAAFRNNPFFTPPEQEHALCADDHSENPKSERTGKKKKKSAGLVGVFAMSVFS
ncbi:MAG TPA: hypothetical protein VJR27_03480 [Candidatus Saccharimonadales bacterium]|nr:hypothetical protein [Candidatus Saccharimonadales bacterium]